MTEILEKSGNFMTEKIGNPVISKTYQLKFFMFDQY